MIQSSCVQLMILGNLGIQEIPVDFNCVKSEVKDVRPKMCAIEGNYCTFYNLLSIYCSKNVSFRIILLTNSQSRFCPWRTGSSRNSTPLMVSFPQICTLDWRTVPYRKTKPGSGKVVYSYLGPTLAGFFGGKARAMAPCFFCTCFRCRNHMMQDMLWRYSLSKQTRARLYNFYCLCLENPCHLRR